MGATDHTEKVLREMHILFSKAPAYDGTNVVVDKNVVINCLRELRKCMYEMMNEYELTVQSREKANREVERENNERVTVASKQAQDIYAASIMFTERSLLDLQDEMRRMQEGVNQMGVEFDQRIREELQKAKANELELKSRLEGLIDEELYMQLIEEANQKREKEKEKAEREQVADEPEVYTHVKADIRVNEDLIEAIGGGDAPPPLEEKNYADIVPEIKVNAAYFEKKGIVVPDILKNGTGSGNDIDDLDIESIEDEVIAETISSESITDGHAKDDNTVSERLTQDISDEELAEISANLDAEYFGWKKEAEEELAAQNKDGTFFGLGKKKQ